MTRMPPSWFLDSFQERKQETFIINRRHFWAYFSKFKFSVTRIREKSKKPLIILEKWQNMSRMSSNSFLNSFKVRKQQIFLCLILTHFSLTF